MSLIFGMKNGKEHYKANQSKTTGEFTLFRRIQTDSGKRWKVLAILHAEKQLSVGGSAALVPKLFTGTGGTTMITAIVASLIIGLAIGATAMAYSLLPKDEGDESQETAEPVKLLTVGCLVRWQSNIDGTVYEIKKFDTDDDNQTVAAIESGGIGFIVPIEELEGVTE